MKALKAAVLLCVWSGTALAGPAQVTVPENGSSLLLLTVALIGVALFRRRLSPLIKVKERKPGRDRLLPPRS